MLDVDLSNPQEELKEFDTLEDDSLQDRGIFLIPYPVSGRIGHRKGLAKLVCGEFVENYYDPLKDTNMPIIKIVTFNAKRTTCRIFTRTAMNTFSMEVITSDKGVFKINLLTPPENDDEIRRLPVPITKRQLNAILRNEKEVIKF